MPEPDPDRRQPADFDRVFAEMTANWRSDDPDADEPSGGTGPGGAPDAEADLTRARDADADTFGRGADADPSPARAADAEPSPARASDAWADDHPLFRQPVEPEPEEVEEEDPGHFDKPEVTPIPWSSLSTVSLVGGALIAFTVAVLLLVLLGSRFPTGVGYAAVGSFVVGFLLLMTRLRRDSDPEGGARL
ncbi:hypothetical protein GC722_15110 [Auraticoccus sp. F435]|uniref:Uncharacterized protein n=1 Tax=Auraticoccus cholistanensis TaxID=2656650 RepID=A0A6A9V1F8_9ACTN|nr:hypothetical protein [Auraticoccus cholistanensis]MVA77339.1 hypothetical protein [Auraticoccus cholistanensis]